MPVMTPQQSGSLGGQARCRNLTPEQRREIARRAGQASGARKREAARRAELDRAVTFVCDNAEELTNAQQAQLLRVVAASRGRGNQRHVVPP